MARVCRKCGGRKPRRYQQIIMSQVLCGDCFAEGYRLRYFPDRPRGKQVALITPEGKEQ